jgi:DNA-binding transcriptional LysR family regulator
MDIKQLTYFLEIIKQGNITKAAEKLHIAQPHLSLQLKLLEEELNVKLIERTTRKFQVTEAGNLLRERSEQVIEFIENTISELKDINEGFKGVISIGTIAAEADSFVLNKVNAFHKKYPDVNFIIRQNTTKEILDLLNNGIIEIGVIRTPLKSSEFEVVYLSSDPMVAVYYDDKYWSEDTDFIDIIDLKNKPLLINFRYEKDILESCESAGFKPRIICKINDARSILLWVKTGMGVAIIPEGWLGSIPNLNLRYKKINDESLLTRTAIVWKKNRYLSLVIKTFLETFIYRDDTSYNIKFDL